MPAGGNSEPPVVIEELASMPGVSGLGRRAVAATVTRRGGRPDRVPDMELVVRGVGIDRDHLWRYARVCGFRLADALPPTYPYVVCFPLGVELMTRSDFPFPLIGLVHVQNTIEQVRPVDAGERFDFTVRAENLREHDRGRAVDLVTTATVDGSVVWRARSAYLRKESTGTKGELRDRIDAPPAARALWRVGV